ncbi:hypothetical protein BH11ACT4_BH11ACT4_13040 [soil metagenome]
MAQGFLVSIDRVSWIGSLKTGYNPAFGARHLSRAIEKELLVPLVASGYRIARIAVGDGELALRPG